MCLLMYKQNQYKSLCNNPNCAQRIEIHDLAVNRKILYKTFCKSVIPTHISFEQLQLAEETSGIKIYHA